MAYKPFMEIARVLENWTQVKGEVGGFWKSRLWYIFVFFVNYCTKDKPFKHNGVSTVLDLKGEFLLLPQRIGRYIWFDGAVAKGRLEAGYIHTIRITDVINARFFQHCSPNPFFETLVKEYISSNWTKYSPLYKVILPNGKKEKRKCDYTKTCLPISLPSNFPLCNSSTPELENIKPLSLSSSQGRRKWLDKQKTTDPAT